MNEENMKMGMSHNLINQAPQLGGMLGTQEKPMDIKTHKRLYDLAYNVKAFIDAHGGLTYTESCRFGHFMQEIINLK